MSAPSMTKDDWAALEMALGHAYGSAGILADGFEVTFQVRQYKMHLVICLYINGWMKGEWLSKKTEEATRFCRPVSFSLFPPSYVKKLTAGLSKSRVKAIFPDLNKKGEYYLPEWRSFRSLKRHLIANNKSIELVNPSSVTQEGGS